MDFLFEPIANFEDPRRRVHYLQAVDFCASIKGWGVEAFRSRIVQKDINIVYVRGSGERPLVRCIAMEVEQPRLPIVQPV